MKLLNESENINKYDKIKRESDLYYEEFINLDKKDIKYAILHPSKYQFLSIGGRSWVEEDSNIIQYFKNEQAAQLFGDKYIKGTYRIIKINESLDSINEEYYKVFKDEKNPNIKWTGAETYNYKGFKIVYSPWEVTLGDKKRNVDTYIILSNYAANEFLLPLRAEDEDGNELNFNTLDQAKDWIDKYKDNFKIEIKHGDEVHAVVNSNLEESKNPLKAAARKHKRKQKGLSPFSYLNPNAGDVEYNVDFFNRAMGSGDASGTGSSEGMGEDLDTAHDSNFSDKEKYKQKYGESMQRNITEADIDLILDNLEWSQGKGTIEFDSLDNNDITFYIEGDHSHTHGYFARLLSDTALKLGYTASKIKEREVGSSYGDWYSSLTTFRIKKRLNKDRYVVLKQDLIDGSFYYYVYDVLESKTVRKPNSNQNNINDYYVFETKPEANKIAKMLNKNINENFRVSELKEELRVWGDEEISAQNDLVKWEQALEDFLENNNIEYDRVKCDVFDYGTNIVIVNPEDIEEVAQEIEDHYGFKTTIEDNNIYVDVTEEYEDEYGDVKIRVSKRYDESLDSEITLQQLADEIDYNGADYKGAEIPKAIDYMINQINIPGNMRLKWFDVDVVSDDVIQLTYVTQEPFSPTDSDSFIKEVTNMINVLANKYRYNKPFTLALDVTARDGRDEGQLVYDINVSAGADMSLKEDISSKKYTLESKLYDYFKATNPNDSFGDDIDREATFRDLFNAINDNANVYKVIFGNENSADSAVREELFNGLANILNTSYSDVYNAWLGYHPLLESNNIIDIRKELNRLDSEEYRDLLNMYDSIELAEHEKKRIAELISQNKIDELVDYLQELYYVYINVYDGNGNGIVTNDLGTFYKHDDLLDDGKFYKHEGLNDKTLKEDIDWDYFDQFETVVNKYMPDRGEGETMASQIVTAVNKLIYKWYNDGDVYDNTYGLQGWANDLSDYANWLYKYVPKTQYTLDLIEEVSTDGGYEEILQLLADLTLNEKFLSKYTDEKCLGSIYNCNGPFKFIDSYDNDEDDF